MTQATQMTITELNDRFRQHNLGHGQVRIAPMVQIMPIERREALLARVVAFNDFNEGNDPC
jgi:hypothetical protein